MTMQTTEITKGGPVISTKQLVEFNENNKALHFFGLFHGLCVTVLEP
uniref:Uncharacterized protein n=1 Tax=Rhizophora mucronata TaxID=61149 RepID=A0A2P2N695_RHIMU